MGKRQGPATQKRSGDPAAKEYSNPTIEVGWVPQDPNDIQPKLSYTIYTRSSTPTAISQINSDLDISLFPNPTENKLYLVSDVGFEGILQIDLHTGLGQFVRSFIWKRDNNDSVELDVSDLQAGYYLVQVKHTTGSKSFRFIKNK